RRTAGYGQEPGPARPDGNGRSTSRTRERSADAGGLDVSAQRVTLTCDEVEELSGLYVLGALTPDEEEQVRAHLATCDQAHASLEAMAPVVPGLLETFEPIEPPEALRASVLAAIAETPQLGAAPIATAPVAAEPVTA